MFKQATRKLKLFKRPTLQISNNILNQPGVDMSLYVSPTQQYNFNWKTIDHICSSDMGLPKKFKKKRFSLHRHFPCCLLLALSIIILKNRTWERSSCGSVGKTSEQFNQGGSEKYWAVPIFDWYHFHIEGPQGVNPLKAPPQTSDLLALMDFTVWERDYSQPKTFFFQTKKSFMNVRHLQFLRRQALPQCGQVAQSRRRIWWRHTSSKRSLCPWLWRSHWRPSAALDVGASLPAEAPRLPILGSGPPMIWRRGAPQNCSRHGFDG